MRLPEGITEEEFLEVADNVANRLGSRFKFRLS